MPAVGVVADDETWASWIEGDTYKALMATRTDEDDETLVIQIRPGQKLTGIGLRMVIVVTWPEHDPDPDRAMAWLKDDVGTRLEAGGMILYESAITRDDVLALPDEVPVPEPDDG